MEDSLINSEDYSGDHDQLFIRLKKWFTESRDDTSDWREQAEEDFDYAAGNQWTDDEKQKLKDQLRPVITFNRIDPVISAVEGTELQNRQEIKYSPREIGDVKVNEVLSAAAAQQRDISDAEFEESDAFRDLIICGMGWVEGTMDYLDNPQGDFKEERIDPLEMFWDTSKAKKNLKDGRFQFRAKKMSLVDARDAHPEADDGDLDASWTNLDNDTTKGAKKSPNESYMGKKETDPWSQEVTIVEAQWWEKEAYYSALDTDGQMKEFDDEGFKTLKQRLQDLGEPLPKNVRRYRKCYYRAFIGSKILEVSKLDCKQFKYKCMTGKRDRNSGTFYGLVRGMKDPQSWSNKFLSQNLHILNSNSKGMPAVEIDAVPDQRKFEQNWANPTKIKWLNPGGTSKIKDYPAVNYPQGLDRLMEFSIASIRDASGVNLELLGLADREQAGVLENTRKQAGLTILAGFFDSLRLLRRDMGRLLMFYIQNYMSDGRLVRVVGKQMEQYVPLVRDQTAGEFDIIVDEAPTSPNQKEQVFAVLMQILPGLMKMGVPVPPNVLDYMPLPSSLTDEWKNYIEQQKQQQPQTDPEVQKMQMQMTMEREKGQISLQNKREELAVETQIAELKNRNQSMTDISRAKIDQQTQLITAKLDQQTALITAAMKSRDEELDFDEQGNMRHSA